MKLTIPQNYVLIRPDPPDDQLKLKCGVTLQLAGLNYNQAENFQRYGTVMAIPEKLTGYFNPNETYTGCEFVGDIEVKVGDYVCYDYLVALSASGKMFDMANPMVLNYEGEECFFLKYTSLYMKVKGEQLTPLNGYILIEPICDFIKTNLYLPEHLKKEKRVIKGRVIKTGSLVRYIKNEEHFSPDTDEIKDGDLVIFRPLSDVPMEDDLHRKTEKKLCAIQRNRILGIIYEN